MDGGIFCISADIVTCTVVNIPMINVSVIDDRWPYLGTTLARAGQLVTSQ